MERVKGIIGAVIGDIAGSSREFRGVPSMRFKLMDSRSTFTDDTVLTMAVAEWMKDRDNVNLEEALELARESALPSHDTPGAIAGAQATAAAIYMARTGSSKEDIRAFLESRFGFDLSSSYEEIRERQMDRLARRRAGDRQAHDELLASDITAMNSVIVFLSSDSYEETIRQASSRRTHRAGGWTTSWCTARTGTRPQEREGSTEPDRSRCSCVIRTPVTPWSP